ncbi:hypothetical protein [Nonomuraea sp. NPDC050310]|uniref:hypothetical protein n=1 Tax=unclassified Nonomuraea TaxID=2593643 RepID=UPI0033C5DB65
MASPRTSAFAVALAGGLLVLSTTTPWMAVEAGVGLFRGGLSATTRGLEDPLGLYTLLAGLAAAALGVAGLLTRRRWLTALAALPGAGATALVVSYVAGRSDVGLDLGYITVGSVLRPGWYGALGCALAVVLFAVLAISRRSRAGATASDRAASPSPH